MKLFVVFICSLPVLVASQQCLITPDPIDIDLTEYQGDWYVQRTNCAPKNLEKIKCMKLIYQRYDRNERNFMNLSIDTTLKGEFQSSSEDIHLNLPRAGSGILNPVNLRKSPTRLNLPQRILDYEKNSHAVVWGCESKIEECVWILTRARVPVDRQFIDKLITQTPRKWRLKRYEKINQNQCYS